MDGMLPLSYKLDRCTLEVLDEAYSKTQFIQKINKLDTPITEREYNNLMSENEKNIQLSNQLIGALNKFVEQTNKVTQALNNNRLKFGLKGHMKTWMNQNNIMRQISTTDTGLHPTVVSAIENAHALPYEEVPSTRFRRGGTKRRMTKRRR